MRKLSFASVAMILTISLYFMVSWGFDAYRMLTSPTYGLDEVWRSQFVFAIGGFFHLSPVGLIKLAAFFAILKLSVAVTCAVHIADRFRVLAGGKAEGEILEAGLMLVVAITILSVGPAVWSQNAELVREGVIQLALAALAVGLLTVERSYGRSDTDARADARIATARSAFDATLARTAPRVRA